MPPALPEARPTVPPGTPRAPHIASVLLPELPAEPILHALESAGRLRRRRVGLRQHDARAQPRAARARRARRAPAVLRFSLSRHTTEDQPALAAQALRAAADEVAAVARPAKRARATSSSALKRLAARPALP